jgi:HEAT repeat protein
MLGSDSPIDRYVAVKALGVVGGAPDFPAISNIAEHDPEGRVALEAAVSLTRLGSDHGLELLRAAIDDPQVPFLRMEAVLALSELYGTPLATRCADLLTEYAQAEALADDEVRQAAIWGLGKDGLRAYARLLPFLDAIADEELVHAVCAFGPDADAALADHLVAVLADHAAPERKRASASFVLARTIPANISAPRLVALRTHASPATRDWALATLGQMSPAAIRDYVADPALAAQLRPLQLTSPETNWTRSEQITDMLTFVRKQTLEAPP